MSRRCISAVLVSILCLVSAGYGEVIIGDFELSYDGWFPDSEDWNWGMMSDIGFSSRGVSHGEWSLYVTKTDGWPWDLINRSVTPQDWLMNDTMKLDVTRLATEWDAGSSFDMPVYIQAGTDDAYYGAQYDNIFGWTHQANGIPQTASVNYQAVKDMVGAVDWVQIAIGQNGGGNAGGITTYYLDYIRLVPEPTTMTLLGLGGLTLLRRKR